jgi:hypothetical protein
MFMLSSALPRSYPRQPRAATPSPNQRTDRQYLDDQADAPMLPLLAIMFGVLLFVTYVPVSFMWLPHAFGFWK